MHKPTPQSPSHQPRSPQSVNGQRPTGRVRYNKRTETLTITGDLVDSLKLICKLRGESLKIAGSRTLLGLLIATGPVSARVKLDKGTTAHDAMCELIQRSGARPETVATLLLTDVLESVNNDQRLRETYVEMLKDISELVTPKASNGGGSRK